MRIVVALLCLCPVALCAQADPRAVQPERPTVATHAHTVAPGYAEIEAGVQADRVAPSSRVVSAPIVSKIGLASHVQLNLSTPAWMPRSGVEGGLGDVGIGLKWRLLDEHPVLGDFALLPSVKLATGSVVRGTGTGTTDVGLTAISSYQVDALAIDLNATLTRVGGAAGAPPSNAALWTASFGYEATRRLTWVVELFGEPTIDNSGTPSSAALLTGPVFLLDRAFSVDVGLITPIRGEIPNALYLGVVWNVGRLLR